MSIKFRCPKCNKIYSVKQEYAGRKAKCSCSAVIVIPRQKMIKGVIYIVDKEHSQLPFFLVYRITQNSTLESSIKQAMASESEIILAKLTVSSKIGEYQQMVLTNRRIIVLIAIARRRDWWGVWHFLRGLEEIPGIGWVLGILLEELMIPIDHLFKRSYRHAERFNEVANEAILSGENLPKRIMAIPIHYAKIVQPSIGVTIRRRWFAFCFMKIRGTTLRFIPVGRLRSAVSGFLDAAWYMLPNQLRVDKLVPVLKALIPHLPFTEIELTEKKDSVSIHWPTNIGIGDKRWSVRGANIVSIGLAVITLLLSLVTYGDEELFLLAILSALITLESLALRRFSDAILIVIFIALILIVTFIKELVLEINDL